MVFEVQIHLVNEYPGVLALSPVGGHPVLNGFQRHNQRRGPKLLSHLVQVNGDDPAVHIHIGGMGEDIEASLRDDLRG